MREEDREIIAEVVEVERFVTTGNIPLIVAAENVRERTINKRAWKEVNETIGVGFAHISNGAC